MAIALALTRRLLDYFVLTRSLFSSGIDDDYLTAMLMSHINDDYYHNRRFTPSLHLEIQYM